MDQAVLFGVVAVPAITGIVQVIKTAGLPSRFAPLAALIFGVFIGLAGYQQTIGVDYVQASFVGIGLGLSASGLYENGQTILGALKGAKT